MSQVTISAINFCIRPVADFEEFAQHAVTLLDRCEGSDLVLLPELFTLELFTTEDDWTSSHTHGILLACARRLLESDAAYLGVPADDREFVFSHAQGIRTQEFRKLRVIEGEGLGGHVRLSRSPARSVDYGHNARFDAQIRRTSLREGFFYSAAAAPVIEDRGGPVEAVLYVANRQPMAYSPEEESLLGEFSQAALFALRSAEAEEDRRRIVRERELTRVTQELHDSLGRHFTQMLHLIQQLGPTVGKEERERVDELSSVLADASAHLRRHLDRLQQATLQGPTSLRAVAAATQEVPSMGLRRDVLFDQDWLPEVVVPGPVGVAMVRAGQEAVYNAELHSNGSHCGVTFTAVSGAIMMTVTDDGHGMAQPSQDQSHWGARLIEQCTVEVGGHVKVSTGCAGTAVELTFPVNEIDGEDTTWHP